MMYELINRDWMDAKIITKCIWCLKETKWRTIIFMRNPYYICEECVPVFDLLNSNIGCSVEDRKLWNTHLAKYFMNTGDERILILLRDERSEEEIKRAEILRERGRLMQNMYNY